MPAERYIPLKGFSLDTADQYMPPDVARYLKNVVYSPVDASQTGGTKGASMGEFKTMESVRVYDSSFSLPAGYNHFAGGFSSQQNTYCLFFNYNENGNHGLYKINGITKTIETVYLKSYMNLQLAPEHFIHEGGAWLEIFNFTDPNTDLPRQRSYFMWVDGYNDMRFICIEDSLATNSFSATQFPYFVGNYDPTLLINAGIPTPLDCLTVTEVPNDTPSLPNELLFNTWQFRVTFIDVYGRPSEHGIISDLYVPGVNDCISMSDQLSRCLDLNFKIDNPLIDKVQIEFRNCNAEQWYLDTVLFLYKGSNLGDWWVRERNPLINFNPENKTITYRFCKDKECTPIPQTETNRTQNPMQKQPQTIAKIGNVMGTANGKSGFSPFGDAIMDKVSVEVIPATGQDSDLATIEIYVPIISPYNGDIQPVWVHSGRGVFGGLSVKQLVNPLSIKESEKVVPGLIDDYKQRFENPDQRGFIGYLAGTGEQPNSTISEQYYVDDSGNFVKVDDYDTFIYNRRYFQKFTFGNVARGKYIFRIAAHDTLLTNKNFAKTSTYTAGTFSWNGATKQVDTNTTHKISDAKELIVDVCNGNYNSENDNKVLAIYDLTNPGSDAGTKSNFTRVAKGYVYEDAAKTIPVELLGVTLFRTGDGYEITSVYTDHNGFYYVADNQKEALYNIHGKCGCNTPTIFTEMRTGNDPGMVQNDQVLTGPRCINFDENPCNRVLIKGKVTLCGTNIPVPGIGVVYSRGATGVTGANGEFTIVAHEYNGPYFTSRVDNIYYMPTVCAYKNCSGEPCLPIYEVIIYPCNDCTGTRIQNVPDSQVSFQSKRGFLSGGQYGVAIAGFDWVGRHTYAQTKDSMYKTMPTLIETQTISPSQLRLLISPDATFPADIKKLVVYVTKELSLSDYISWIVDRVQFIDNSGNENKTSPTQIKIYYGSLNEYNIQNNFNTTTHWQFIVQDNPQINYTSDYVEFYMNGDGTFFPTLVRARVKYDQSGQYFLIDYDSALKDLKDGALIRLARPADCVDRDRFFTICQSIDVVNGKAVQNSIILNAYDTYYKYRQIPIPVPTEEPDETENVIRTFGFPFEHNSPSDLWGEKCSNIGSFNARNPYEAEIVYENQVALSGALSVNGQLNFLNYFDEDKKINFNSWDFGGIVAMLPETAIILMVCQNICFTVGYNDNILRTNANGEIISPSAEDRFGKPNVNIGNDYGCLLFDKNTIRRKQGLVQFLDTSEACLIQHNWQDANPVSNGVIESWLRPKIKYINEYNKTNVNKKYWHGGIDPAANAYNLTDFTLRSDSYVNTERGYDITTQETFSFDFYNKIFRVWWGFTPQGYVYLSSDLLDKQVFSMAKGNIYYHYNTNSDEQEFGTVYGEVVEKVFRFVCVTDNMKQKYANAIQVYCPQSVYFADQILTDNGQRSRILKDHWKKGQSFYSAPFLCDVNTNADPNIPTQTGINKIVDGNKLYGTIFDIRLISDPEKNNQYTQLTGAVVSVTGIEQSGT